MARGVPEDPSGADFVRGEDCAEFLDAVNLVLKAKAVKRKLTCSLMFLGMFDTYKFVLVSSANFFNFE